ncbi:MAG: hypothetical protein AB1405_12580, partial [Bdellovibrionota bacterium]
LLGDRNPTVANNRSYQMIRRLSIFIREVQPRFSALSRALGAGVQGEIKRARQRGELPQQERRRASGKSALELVDENH